MLTDIEVVSIEISVNWLVVRRLWMREVWLKMM